MPICMFIVVSICHSFVSLGPCLVVTWDDDLANVSGSQTKHVFSEVRMDFDIDF